jgi:hypothetical protein
VKYRRLWRPKLWAVPGLVALLLLSTGAGQATSSVHAASATASCTWKLISSPNPGNDSNFLAGVAAASSNDVWAVGNFQTNGAVQTLTEHWQGNKWSVVPSPSPGSKTFPIAAQLNAVAHIPGTQDDFWAVGEYFSTYWHTLIIRWDDSQWTVVPSPNVGQESNYLKAITVISEKDAWAVGSVFDGNNTITLTEHWNGKQWSIVPSPNTATTFSTLVAVSARSSTDIWAVGSAVGITLIEHWNGKNWSIVPSPATGAGSALSAVSSVPDSKQLWATGYYFPPSSGNPATLIERWNGKSWSIVPSPNPGAGFNVLQGITAISATNVWAVGDYSPGEIPIIALVEHWNGKSWSVVSVPSSSGDDDLFGVARTPHTHTLWAVGNAGSGTLTEVCR